MYGSLFQAADEIRRNIPGLDISDSFLSRNIVKILGVEVALGEILQKQVSFQDSMNKMTLGELNTLLGTTVRK